MDDLKGHILYKTRQHKIVLFFNFIKGLIVLGVPFCLILYFVLSNNMIIFFTISIIFILIILYYNFFFWNKSWFIITNKQISKNVRNGLFSEFQMCIYFENIRDIAYSKNNLFHYIFNYGTIFARSSAGAEGDFMINRIPNIAKVYKIINYIHILPSGKREHLIKLDDLNKKEKESTEEIIEIEKNKLLSIKGIKEVVILNNNDKKYLFENEEDKNHGVFETIRKKIVLCFTHDYDFREADDPILLKLGKKVIFPAVSFHEITRPSTVSSSPGVKIHKYLSEKFDNLAEDDATVLVGFDL